MMEQKFATFLLDRVDEKIKGMAGPEAAEIKLYLKELRGVVDTALEGPARNRNRGGSNA